MGSPNFYTDREIISNVGLDQQRLALRMFGPERLFDNSDDELDEAHNEMQRVLAVVEDLLHDVPEFLNHTIELKMGYHSGFQLYVDSSASIDDFIATSVFLETPAWGEDEGLDPKSLISVFTQDGYVQNHEDNPKIGEWAEVTGNMDEHGMISFEMQKNYQAIARYLEEERDRAQHEVARIAKEAGLAVIIGLSYTSSLASDADSEKLFGQHIMDEWLPTVDQDQTYEAHAPRG